LFKLRISIFYGAYQWAAWVAVAAVEWEEEAVVVAHLLVVAVEQCLPAVAAEAAAE
jgi:hypothetical protein